MKYTISEVAREMGVNPSAIRFYESEGLLPHVKRENGRRYFTEEDFAWLRLLNCLRSIGTPVREMKEYIELAERGDETLQERYDLILRQKQSLQDQIETLQLSLKEIEYKEWYYQTAIAAGTESIHQQRPMRASFEPDDIPDED